MICLVTKQLKIPNTFNYNIITMEQSLEIMRDWTVVQYDSETDGTDCHINNLLCIQFGNKKADVQIVVDCSTIDILAYKDILESKFIVGFNLKFDLQFLYKYNIVPKRVYDAMIVEQLLYLGYPSGIIPYNLKAVAERRLDIYIDKTVRGEIIWRGLDESVIMYAAHDVVYLEDIMNDQLKECKEKNCLEGAKVECNAVPAVAYMEYCGIHLDSLKWKEKMKKDKQNLEDSIKALNDYCLSNPKLSKWKYIDPQGDLFTGFQKEPIFNVDWQKKEAVDVIKTLGFNTSTISKTTNKESDSIMEKVLSSQKGIDDAFLKLYFDYQGYYKVISSFGQGHLDAINPITGRLHTNFWQLGTTSGK